MNVVVALPGYQVLIYGIIKKKGLYKMVKGRNEHVGSCITETALEGIEKIMKREDKLKSEVISDAIEAYIKTQATQNKGK